MKQEIPRHIPRSCCEFRAKATGIPATPPKPQQQRGNLRKTALNLRKTALNPRKTALNSRKTALNSRKTALDLRKNGAGSPQNGMAAKYGPYLNIIQETWGCISPLIQRKGETRAPKFAFGRRPQIRISYPYKTAVNLRKTAMNLRKTAANPHKTAVNLRKTAVNSRKTAVNLREDAGIPALLMEAQAEVT